MENTLKRKRNYQLLLSERVSDLIDKKEDFIYIKKSVLPLEVFPFKNLQRMICDIGEDTSVLQGMPLELISYMDMSLFVPDSIYSENEDIIYYSPPGCDTKENVIRIIKIFNALSEKITIYLSEYNYLNVKDFANQNISFSIHNRKKTLIKAKLVITYGYSSRKFIKQKIPTIILGPYGFGRWVTPKNILTQFKNNFRGRLGGTYLEETPLPFLIDDLIELKMEKNLGKILTENQLRMTTYLEKVSFCNLIELIFRTEKFYYSFNNFNGRKFLKPKIASNVEIKRNKNIVLGQRQGIKDLLFSLPSEEIKILKDLNGQINCEEIRKKYKMHPKEFYNLIRVLWERKAIVFSHE